MTPTEEQLKIRAWAKEQNAKTREAIRERELPTAEEIVEEGE